MENDRNTASITYSGPDGECVVSLNKESTSVGRLADRDIRLTESFTSRAHASIIRTSGGYEVQDIDSAHGTWINGQKRQRARLADGDVLQFGSPQATRVYFRRGSHAGSTAGGRPADALLSALSLLSSPVKEQQPAAREMEQLNFLLNAARQLNAGEAKVDVVQALLRLSIQLTDVERGFVFLQEMDGLHLAFGLRADGSTIPEDSTISHRAMQRAIESTERFSVSDTFGDGDVGAWESVVANSIRCIYCIPLRERATASEVGKLLGLLYLDSQLKPGSLTQIDHQLLDTVAIEAATLLSNALLAEREVAARRAAEELAMAANIHAGLMSIALPQLPYATIRARAIPCTAIGGDFYNLVDLGDCLGFALADVSGKGVPASIVAATLQGIIHAQMLSGQHPAKIADLVNRFLCERSIGKYATMVLMKLYPNGRLEYVNCGHIRPLIVKGGKVGSLEHANLMVGLIAGAEYEGAECMMAPGDRILLASDGVTEAENAEEEQFGDARFLESAASYGLDGILGRLAEFQASHPAQDDCTLVEVQFQPSEPPGRSPALSDNGAYGL